MDGEETIVYQDDEFVVVVEEVDPFWQWSIYRGEAQVQNGVALSESSARLAGLKVLTYLQGRT
ncbi:hypothetical protein CRM90_28925 [Mycobacterium sp. ENV421]|uniref:hypothetical protein n=1 Tax=Mycobacterium sp. ENV421 TaxID=1213407 RepID=UPI000C9D23B5|nr:hypothetical protein [Mycobacterium sp. ENV421]PND54256.1 hypothetical protein CRM90_28925 [Mycobacterium sp. ENV421]